jgi:hypothetical protein
MGQAIIPLLVAVAIVVACGPMTPERAERECLARARSAAGPEGMLKMGVRSDGQLATSLQLSVSSDYLMGRDPSALYNACVYKKTGQPPRQPLYTLPDWRG